MMRKLLLLVALLGLPLPAFAQQYTISPPPFLLAQNNSGTIINNACIWTYTAGTTTAATTYSDSTGTQNSNPIRSDSAGRFTAFLAPGNSYKFVYESACTPPAHGTTLRTADNISAMPPSGVNVDITGTAGETINAGSIAYLSDGSGSKNAGQWYNASNSNSYSSTTAAIVGAATATVSGTGTGTFRIAGRVTGLSALTVGGSYYIASSAGTITTTQPTTARLLGRADSATSLVLLSPQDTTTNPLSIAEGRLTGTTGVCRTQADVTGVATIFYTPCNGNRIALYDGSASWNVKTFSEISISVAGCTASKPYDVFLYDNAGTVASEILVWTNDTTRATAITQQDGVDVKTGATTRRFVGSFYCNASAGQTDDSALKRNICNRYNPITRQLKRLEATASWTYSSQTVHQANASTSNQVEAMICREGIEVDLSLSARYSDDTVARDNFASIGEDSTTTFSPNAIASEQSVFVANYSILATARLNVQPTVGRHFYTWLEATDAVGVTTWYGVSSSASLRHQQGLSGSVNGL